MSSPARVACFLAVTACLLCCGSTDTPSLVALERQRVQELSTRANDDPEAVEGPLRVRWNPAPCECPAFEVLVDGEWVRAEVKASTPDAEAVLAPYEAHPDAPLWEWAARGRVKPGKAVSSGLGQSALAVEVRWLGQDASAAPASPSRP